MTRSKTMTANKPLAPYMLAFVAGALAFSAAAQTQAHKPSANPSLDSAAGSIADKLVDRFAAFSARAAKR